MERPITPAEAATYKAKKLPQEVLEAWNKLIAQNFDGKVSRVLQADAVAAIQRATDCTGGFIARAGWLDIEPMYEAAGWRVEYDKPGYNESYPATFTFRPKKREGK